MRNKLIFFTGAGISVDSGIPTFQEQPGIRDKLHRDFANNYPEAYRDTIREMLNSCENALPNAAHIAIAELGAQVITMNIDRLHTKAGSNNVLEVHGVLPTRAQLEDEFFPMEYKDLVLYGDMAPKYSDAEKMVKNLEYGNSYFIIVGTSFYTGISERLRRLAHHRKAKVIIINDNASTRVPHVCELLKGVLINNQQITIDGEDCETYDIPTIGYSPYGAWDWD